MVRVNIDAHVAVFAALVKALGQRMPDGSYRAVLTDHDLAALDLGGKLERLYDPASMATVYRYVPPPTVIDGEFTVVSEPVAFITSLTNRTD